MMQEQIARCRFQRITDPFAEVELRRDARARRRMETEGDDSDNEVYLNANASGLIKQLAFEGRRR